MGFEYPESFLLDGLVTRTGWKLPQFVKIGKREKETKPTVVKLPKPVVKASTAAGEKKAAGSQPFQEASSERTPVTSGRRIRSDQKIPRSMSSESGPSKCQEMKSCQTFRLSLERDAVT
jgi:hypothetical protein